LSPADRRLTRHLAIVVLVKLVLLAGLWWAFVRDAQVVVDPASAAQHLVSIPPSAGEGD
jgi:hypothetical protein